MKENKILDIKKIEMNGQVFVPEPTKTEKIRESELQDEFMAFWDEYKDKVGLGNYSDEVTRFWFKKLSEQRQEEHNTNDGWCCACAYDKIELNRRIEEKRQSILEEVKVLKKTKWEEPIQNKEGYILQVYNFALDTVISIIKEKR